MKIKKQSKVKTNLKSGVTLVALVITIIVLLILSGITINLIIGEEGIIKRAEQAGGEYANAATSEREELAELTNRTDEIITNVTEFNKPKEKIIEIELKGEKEQTNVPVNLSLGVKTDGEKITNYKWVLNNKSEEIGIEEEKYTEEALNVDNIELKINEEGTYYLHVLTTDDKGVKKETVKGPITVTANRHSHTGSTSSEGGCYTIPVYHSHVNSCYCPGPSQYYLTHWIDNGVNTYQRHEFRCQYCGGENGYNHSNPYGYTASFCVVGRVLCTKTPGGTVDSYTFGCGKDENTIESVSIVY